MAKLSLNIYGKNDEILNTYETEHVRWGLLLRALDLQEEIKDADQATQLGVLQEFVKEIFVGITDDEIKNADSGDVVNVVSQITRMAGKIKGKNA